MIYLHKILPMAPEGELLAGYRLLFARAGLLGAYRKRSAHRAAKG